MLHRFFGIHRFFDIFSIGWKNLYIDDIRHRNIMTIHIILIVPFFKMFINSYFSDFYKLEFNPNIKDLYDFTFYFLLLPFNYIYFIITEWTNTLATTGVILFLRLLVELMIRIKYERKNRRYINSGQLVREIQKTQELELKEEENLTLEIVKVEKDQIDKDQIKYIVDNIEYFFIDIALSSDKQISKDLLSDLGLRLRHDNLDGHLSYQGFFNGFQIDVGLKFSALQFFVKEKNDSDSYSIENSFKYFLTLLDKIKYNYGGYFKTKYEYGEFVYLINKNKKLVFRANKGSNYTNFQIDTRYNTYSDAVKL